MSSEENPDGGRGLKGRPGALALGVVLALALAPSGAAAATISVNTTADETASDTTCSLREALNAANDDSDAGGDCVQGSGSDTIQIPAGTYTLTLAGAGDDANVSGDLDVTDTLGTSTTTTFQGAGDGPGGTIIDAAGSDRAIDVQPTAQVLSVAVKGLTIRNGSAPGPTGQGGAIRMGELDGQLSLDSSRIGSSSAGEYGGGIFFGIAAVGGVKLNVLSSEIVGNTAGEEGGGIWFQGQDPAERAVVNQSLVAGNSADKGGGIYVNTATPGSQLEVVNSTVAGNSATGTDATDGGGGIGAGATDLQLYLSFDTIAGNSTALASGAGGVQTEADNQNVTFVGTIIAGNTPVNCREIAPGDGTFAGHSEGYNLESADSCELDPLSQSDLVNTDPVLAPLGNYGGITKTRGLYDTSPAIDRVPRAVTDHCFSEPGAVPLSVDQRGFTRPPTPGLCDVGAFEGSVGPVPPPPSGPAGITPVTVTVGGPKPLKPCKKKKHRSAAAAKKKKCKKKRK